MLKWKLPHIPAVTTEELAFAYQVGGAAAAGAIPASGVGGMGVNLDMGDGSLKRYELTDTAQNRAAIAIRDQFPQGMLRPLLFRIWAMSALLEASEAEPFIRKASDGSDHLEISEAVFEVAARMPLNSKAEFAKKQFFRQVAEEFAKNPDLPILADGAA